MDSIGRIKDDIDKETQCNFYVKDCLTKSCQTYEPKKTVSGKGSQSKKIKLYDKEINAGDCIGKIMLWIKKLKDSNEINQNVTLLEKTSFNTKMRYLEIFRQDIFIPEIGSEPVKFLVNDVGDATMYTVFDGPVVQGNLFENEELRESVALSFFKPVFEEGYTFCAGVSSEAKEKLSSLPYVPKNISVYSHPYTRSSSKMCSVWFKSPKNMPKKFEKSIPQCKPCRDVSRHVRTLGIHKNEEAHASPSSKCALKYLSSSTISMRKSTSRVQKHRLMEANQKLKEQCEQLKLELSSKQSKGMDDMTKLINKQYKQDLDILFS